MALVPIQSLEDLEALQVGDTVLKSDLTELRLLDEILINGSKWKQATNFDEVEYVGESGGAVVTIGGQSAPLDVLVGDQTTRPILNPMCQGIGAPFALASDTTPDTYIIQLVDATGLSSGDEIALFQNSNNPGFYFGTIQGIVVNTLTMHQPIDIVFATTTANLFLLNCDLNVDGSIGGGGREIFTIANNSTTPIDITRIIFTIETATAPEYSEFGDLPALTRGIVLRKKKADGTFNNIFTAKTNKDLQRLMYDIAAFDTGGFFGGVEGLAGRLTFAGANKLGVAIRLEENEALELLVQDDLTGLVAFRINAEGHFTDEVA